MGCSSRTRTAVCGRSNHSDAVETPLLSLKSLALEKLENIQEAAQETIYRQVVTEKEECK